MATPMTIREEKFHLLLSRFDHQAEVIPLPCPGLMEYVEAGKGDSDEVESFLRDLLGEFAGDEAQTSLDAVVLGCTHYPFIRHRIRKILGEQVEIFDGGEGTARELARRLTVAGLLREESGAGGSVEFRNSDPSPEKLRLSERLLGAAL